MYETVSFLALEGQTMLSGKGPGYKLGPGAQGGALDSLRGTTEGLDPSLLSPRPDSDCMEVLCCREPGLLYLEDLCPEACSEPHSAVPQPQA